MQSAHSTELAAAKRARAGAHAAALQALDPRLFDVDFDAVTEFLSPLPPTATATDTDAAAETAAADLAAVDGALAAALQKAGPGLERGLAWVGDVYADVSSTVDAVLQARVRLAAVRAPVDSAAALARAGARRARLAAAAAELGRLRTGVRAALAAVEGDGAFAGDGGSGALADCGAAAFSAAAAARAALAPLTNSAAAAAVLSRVAAGEAAALASARAALAGSAAAFGGGDRFGAALRAYQAGGPAADLRADLASAFASGPSSAMLSVVRGAALTRARSGGPDDGDAVAAARAATTVAAAAALVPPQAWAPAFADACLCGWDALAAHASAAAWLDAAAAAGEASHGLTAETLATARSALSASAGRAWAGAAAAAVALLRCPGASCATAFPAGADAAAAFASAGDAFAPPAGGDALRPAAAAAAVAALDAAHAAHLADLQAALNAESWAVVADARVPRLAWAGGGGGAHPAFPTWSDAVVAGNPWKGGRGDAPPPPPLEPQAHGWTAASAAAAAAAASYTSAAARHPAWLAPAARAAAFELLETVLVHTAAAFGGTPLSDLVGVNGASAAGRPPPWSGDLADPASAAAIAAAGTGSSAAGPPPSAHLASALSRAVTASLPGLRTVHGLGRAPPRPPPGAGGVDAGGACGAAAAAFNHAPGAPTPKSHPGNLHALAERCAGLSGLAALGACFAGLEGDAASPAAVAARAPGGRGPSPGEAAAVVAAATADLRPLALAAAARLNLPLGAVRAAVAATRYDLADPPAGAHPWVAVAGAAAAALGARLCPPPPGVSPADARGVWRAGRAALAAAAFDGLAAASVGSPTTSAAGQERPADSPCTAMGRSAMSFDAHELAGGLARAGGPPEEGGGGGAGATAAAVSSLLAPLHAYVKAWYLPPGPDLRSWARAAAGVDLTGGASGARPPPIPRPAAACLLHSAGAAGGQDKKVTAAAVSALDAELAGAAAAAALMEG